MKANPSARRAHRAARALAPVAVAALLVTSTAACGSDTSGEGTDQGVHTLTPEPEESPSEAPSPRTQESFAASVSAESERVRQEATKRLEEVEGRGNAVGDVSVNGLPLTAAEEVRSALVRVTNPTDEATFFAVKVEFVDAGDKVLDTVVVGVEDAPPDRTVTARANSRKAAGVKTFPRVAQAERG